MKETVATLQEKTLGLETALAECRLETKRFESLNAELVRRLHSGEDPHARIVRQQKTEASSPTQRILLTLPMVEQGGKQALACSLEGEDATRPQFDADEYYRGAGEHDSHYSAHVRRGLVQGHHDSKRGYGNARDAQSFMMMATMCGGGGGQRRSSCIFTASENSGSDGAGCGSREGVEEQRAYGEGRGSEAEAEETTEVGETTGRRVWERNGVGRGTETAGDGEVRLLETHICIYRL